MFITDFPNSIDVEDNFLKTTNRAFSVLLNPISPVDLSFEVIDGSKFPLGAQLVTIENEIIACSSRTGNIFTVSVGGRGYSGTIASGHSMDVRASSNFTSHHWNNLIDAIIAMQAFVIGASPPSNVLIPSGQTVNIKTISKIGFSDIDFKIKIAEDISEEIIKFNLRIIKSPTQLKNTIFGKIGTFPESDIDIIITETPTDILIDIENLRPNSINVLIANEI